jgi:hypothetical protein
MASRPPGGQGHHAAPVFLHTTRRQPGKRCFKEMRGQLGLDTMGNLVMIVDNIIQRRRLVCLSVSAVCHVLCMPSDAAPAAAVVSQATSYEHLKKLRACACSRLQAGWKLGAESRAPRRTPVQRSAWHSASGSKRATTGIIRCTYIDTFITVCYIIAAYTALPPPRPLPPPPWPALPAYGRRPGCRHCRPLHQCQCEFVRCTAEPPRCGVGVLGPRAKSLVLVSCCMGFL